MLEAYENINKKKTDKKNEEDRLAKELKEIKLQRQYLNANAAMVEEMAAAATGLRSQAADLVGAMAVFKLRV